jgi:hypothetical protein
MSILISPSHRGQVDETDLELLLLLLQDIQSTTEAHHVRSHHIRQHVGETKRSHLLVMTASGSTELLETLELGLSLSEFSSTLTKVV